MASENNRLIAVLCNEDEDAHPISLAVEDGGLECAVVPDIPGLRDLLIETPVSGILFSIPTMIRLDPGGKEFVRTLESLYPVARARWNRSAHDLSVIGAGGTAAKGLPAFLTVCSSFPIRRLRRSERVPKSLNTTILGSDGTEAEKTCTFVVSAGGCFIHTCREFRVEEQLRVTFKELDWAKPILATVRMYVPWGRSFQPAGIGVEFLGLAEEQVEMLKVMLFGKK